MNYLAHAYFSFGHPQVTVGNLISDFVKGRKKYDYPIDIQKGIALHRDIDTFTDNSEATRKAKEVFRPAYRLYSAPLTDVAYDYFLANDANEFTEDGLFRFSRSVYGILDEYQDWLPEAFARIFPYMKSQNWLYRYRTKQGLQSSFRGLVMRSMYLTESDTANTLFDQNYDYLQDCYRELMQDIKPFARQRLQELMTS